MITSDHRTMGAEDCSLFLNAAPGAYVFIGAGNKAKGYHRTASLAALSNRRRLAAALGRAGHGERDLDDVVEGRADRGWPQAMPAAIPGLPKGSNALSTSGTLRTLSTFTLPHRLRLHQARILALRDLHERRMRADFEDAAIFEHNDLVGFADC